MCERCATTPTAGRPQRHPAWREDVIDLAYVADLLQDAKSELSRDLSEWLDWRAREHPDFPRQWLDD